MMGYDEKVPLLLKREQQWFGSIIGRAIDEDSKMNPISPSGVLMEEEAAEHIAPSPTMRPAQRIQIYNQQYWWRLLNTLQESFPLVTRLFGYVDFNRIIGIPYLTKYPPRHWSLAMLGDRLSRWCLEEYQSEDRELVSQAAELDWAFSCCFTMESVLPSSSRAVSGMNLEKAVQDNKVMQDFELESLSRGGGHSQKVKATPVGSGCGSKYCVNLLSSTAVSWLNEDSEDFFDQTLSIQPFIYLFAFEYDLFQYRVDFLKKEPDYWLNFDFPVLDRSKPYHYVLFRNQKNDLSWKQISYGEFLILSLLKEGSTLANICEIIENQEPQLYQTAVENLQLWFQEWAQRGWLTVIIDNEH